MQLHSFSSKKKKTVVFCFAAVYCIISEQPLVAFDKMNVYICTDIYYGYQCHVKKTSYLLSRHIKCLLRARRVLNVSKCAWLTPCNTALSGCYVYSQCCCAKSRSSAILHVYVLFSFIEFLFDKALTECAMQ